MTREKMSGEKRKRGEEKRERERERESTGGREEEEETAHLRLTAGLLVRTPPEQRGRRLAATRRLRTRWRGCDVVGGRWSWQWHWSQGRGRGSVEGARVTGFGEREEATAWELATERWGCRPAVEKEERELTERWSGGARRVVADQGGAELRQGSAEQRRMGTRRLSGGEGGGLVKEDKIAQLRRRRRPAARDGAAKADVVQRLAVTASCAQDSQQNAQEVADQRQRLWRTKHLSPVAKKTRIVSSREEDEEDKGWVGVVAWWD
ncbi:hypothetical protein Syun_016866 [Stephania yunnanensis]|uniref:Uncharacterized protein n=1 Tax=Stephania yunnanensis TaxID=152371 RepID=A0AAP0J5W3_9MAGN